MSASFLVTYTTSVSNFQHSGILALTPLFHGMLTSVNLIMNKDAVLFIIIQDAANQAKDSPATLSAS